MARTATYTLNGTTYTLCYSTRVLCEIEDRYESQSAFYETLVEKTSVKIEFLSMLMQAGAIYDRQQGLEPPDPLSTEEIKDMTTLEDQEDIMTALMEAIKAGSKQKVEAKPTSKKANGERRSPEK